MVNRKLQILNMKRLPAFKEKNFTEIKETLHMTWKGDAQAPGLMKKKLYCIIYGSSNITYTTYAEEV